MLFNIFSEFYNLVANIKVAHPDVNEIHVLLASQASFAFRLGTMITTSVMPMISVYQFDSELGMYGWCVSFTAGQSPFLQKTPLK